MRSAALVVMLEVEVGSGPSSLMERQGFGNGRRVQVLGMLKLARAKRRGGTVLGGSRERVIENGQSPDALRPGHAQWESPTTFYLGTRSDASLPREAW